MVQAPRVNESDSPRERLQIFNFLERRTIAAHFDGPHNDKFLILSTISIVGCLGRGGRRGVVQSPPGDIVRTQMVGL